MTLGIYIIKNRYNGKLYVGSSEKTSIKRTTISECSSGRNKTAGKLQWKYKVQF